MSGIFLWYCVWKPSIKNIKNALFLPFVREIYPQMPKPYAIMSWLNVIRKYKWLKFVDEETGSERSSES